MLQQSAKPAKSEEAIKYYNKGNSFYDLKKYKDAIEVYNKAISLNLDDVEAINNKSIVIQKLGSVGDAKCM